MDINMALIKKNILIFLCIIVYITLSARPAQSHTLHQKYLDNILNGKAWVALRDATKSGDLEDKEIIKSIILNILNFDNSGHVTEGTIKYKIKGGINNLNSIAVWEVESEYEGQKFKTKILKKRIVADSYGESSEREKFELMAWEFDDLLNLGIVPPVVINSTPVGENGAYVYSLFVDNTISDNYRILAPNDIGIERDSTIIMDYIFGNRDRLYKNSIIYEKKINDVTYAIQGWGQTNYLIGEEGYPIAIDNEFLVEATGNIKKEYISEEAYYDFAYSKDIYDTFIDHSNLSPGGYDTLFLETHFATIEGEVAIELKQSQALEKVTARWNEIAKELHERFGAPDYDWSNNDRLHKQYANNRKSAIDQFREGIDVPTDEFVLGTDISKSKNEIISERLLSKNRGESKTLKKIRLCE